MPKLKTVVPLGARSQIEEILVLHNFSPDCKPEGPLFSAEFVCESVYLCVCLSVCL